VRSGAGLLTDNSRTILPDTEFGFALPPTWATVYYELVLRLAKKSTDSESNVSVILSCLIAHEIGHLLLGQNAHTADGIMTARWQVEQIQQALRRQLKVKPEQARVMLQNAKARTNTFETVVPRQPSHMTPGCFRQPANVAIFLFTARSPDSDGGLTACRARLHFKERFSEF